jgi:CDP-paratose 2-epimerase
MKNCRNVLVTGSSGLIGSEVVSFFSERFESVHGIDNNQREIFFGPQGSTRWNQERLILSHSNFVHHELDIRNREGIQELIKKLKPEVIVHAAAQPSHDRAADIPFDDFDTNTAGTLNLLEASRRYCPDTIFIYLSTNKVYGDRPNDLKLIENHTRYDYGDENFMAGISESFSIDQSKHSLFGASKLAADILVQEYGRYFGIKSCVLRGGCLTGPGHSGVELHGFLSYLIKCNLEGIKYSVFGYKGKQVRDNIHSWDVANFIWEFIKAPRVAEVYNLGGGKGNSISILEAFDKISALSGREMVWEYVDRARSGDHIVYYSNLEKLKNHYPEWKITKDIDLIFKEIYEAWKNR